MQWGVRFFSGAGQVTERSHVPEKTCNPLHSALTQQVSLKINQNTLVIMYLLPVRSGQLRFLGLS